MCWMQTSPSESPTPLVATKAVPWSVTNFPTINDVTGPALVGVLVHSPFSVVRKIPEFPSLELMIVDVPLLDTVMSSTVIGRVFPGNVVIGNSLMGV